jgi:hypothetical protein
MRRAALKRGPLSAETRAKVSANSAKAKDYRISRLDGSSFLSPSGDMVTTLHLRTLPVAADFSDCGEKTIRRAVQANGIVKRTWVVKVLR